MRSGDKTAIVFAVLAALLYALSSPFSKLLLNESVGSNALAAYLYLGAGAGMLLLWVIRRVVFPDRVSLHESFNKSDIPFIVLMIVLDMAAPLLLLAGLNRTNAETVSLLNNFEIAATTLIAFAFFKERIKPRVWLAVVLILIASILLSFEDISSFKMSLGGILVLLACCSWGFENNCTSRLSKRDPLKVVVIKGFGSGAGCLVIALLTRSSMGGAVQILLSLLLGFLAYGLSIFFYVWAQRTLGAARTGAYYAVAPFIGVFLSMLIFRELPGLVFFVALAVMIVGVYLVSTNGKAANTQITQCNDHKECETNDRSR